MYTLLVVPRVDYDLGWVPELEGFYGADIARLFTKVAESETWTIRRKGDGGVRSPRALPRLPRAHGARRPRRQDDRSGGRESGGAERQRAKGQGRIGGRACREAAAAGGEQVGNPVHPERMVDNAVGSVRPHRRGADDV